MPEYTINCLWDSEATVWVATSGDIPGLVMESGSLDALIERVKAAVPELLELAGTIPLDTHSLVMRLTSERRELVAL
jgi:hypothetical protein